MKRFAYFSFGLLCLAVSALVGFHLGSGAAEAQLARPVAGIAYDVAASTVIVLETDGDVWSRRVEYLDVIDGYGEYVPSLSVSPPARYLGNFFYDSRVMSNPAFFSEP